MRDAATNRPIGVSEQKTFPILTMLMGFVLVLVYYFYQQAHSQTWLTQNTFAPTKFFELFSEQKWGDILHLLFISNSATLELWQLILSLYFLCLFGIPVEKRLRPVRFILLIILAGTIPWLIQLWDVSCNPVWPMVFEHSKRNVNFFGPIAIIIALTSAYLVLVPKRERDRTESRLYRKDRTEIFNRTPQKAVSERFGFSPQVFACAFFVYAVIQRFCMVLFWKNFDSIGLYASASAVLIGYFLATFIHVGMEETFQEHPLKHAAIKQYYELVDLDVSHDNAVKGAAKGLGLPDYQVEEWVKKSKGKLRPT